MIVAPLYPCRLLTAIAMLAAVATLACGDKQPFPDHTARLARAAARGLPTHLLPDWGPTGPHGIACAARMRDARDSTVQLLLATQDVHTETTRRGDTTIVQRWAEGEYLVTPPGWYRDARGDTLRVDCSRGAAIAPPSA